MFISYNSILALQSKLNEEKSARQKSDQNFQEKERQISMLSVDYRQIQQRLQKLEGEYRQVIKFPPRSINLLKSIELISFYYSIFDLSFNLTKFYLYSFTVYPKFNIFIFHLFF